MQFCLFKNICGNGVVIHKSWQTDVCHTICKDLFIRGFIAYLILPIAFSQKNFLRCF